MSSIKPLDPPATKPDSKPIGNRNHGNNKSQNNRRKFKDRGCRKRSKSFSGCGLINPKPVLPTKFLLGGNINDPLNLNSLQDEDINRAMNAVTPKSSPLPTPPRRKMRIEVIVSPNTHDPLHLLDCQDDIEYEEQLCSPVKKGRKKRINKKRRTMSSSAEGAIPDPTGKSEARTPEASSDSAKIPEDPKLQEIIAVAIEKPVEVKPAPISKACRNLSFEAGKDKKDRPKRRSEEGNIGNASKRFKNSMDKIVSPVVPQPGAWLKRSISIKLPKPRQNKVPDEKEPVFKETSKKFQYGNYNRYYGYRNPNNETDHRLRVFSHHPYLFENKDILDIGCNIGHITLSVARDFRARNVTGIDIDPNLISIARKNVKHYVKTEENTPPGSVGTPDTKTVPKKSSSEFFPISMPILYGPIDIPGFHDSKEQGRGFPKNVTFKQCNYVLEDESLLALEQPQFDVILCLSITKWIQLNWGDNGLKLAFRRMYEQLRPGGKLILEPQHWAGYKAKKKLTETIYKNYNSIEFFPDKFRDFLLSPTVGFAKSEILGYPQHRNSGFRRPIQVFTKSTMFPSERYEGATPSNAVYNDSVYTKIMETGKYESQTSLGSHREFVYTNICQPSSISYTPEDTQDSQNDICPTTSPNVCTASPNVVTSPNSFTVSPSVCTTSPMVYSSSPNVSTTSPIVYAPSPNVSTTSSLVYAPAPNVCTTSPLERVGFSPEGSPYLVSEESSDRTKTPSSDIVVKSSVHTNSIGEEVSEVNSERKTDGDKT